jgi:hypothetical protein
MTRAEELRDKIYTKAAAHIGILESEFSCSPDENRTYEELTRELATDLYALISAARAEGVAEGFEQGVIAGVTEYKTRLEAEIRKVSHVERRGFEFGKETQVLIIPASVLAPKEKP